MKNVTRIFGSILLASLLILVAGCTKRSNPAIPEVPPAGSIFDADHDYDGVNVGVAIWSQLQSRHVSVYLPPGYDPTITGPRYPVLYLLPGYDGEPSFFFQKGNENYYQLASIAKIADRLIASGEIKPMLIVLPDASVYYGGSFYANSSLAGKWEDMMSLELVKYVDESFRTIAVDSARAISGHSSGGYGAFRIAMKNDTLFRSVSAIDAPLAFDGSGTEQGIKRLFQPYLTESGINSQATYLATDTSGFRSQPVKILLYSMAATFSPAPKDISTKFGNLQIALPFDYQGVPVQTVWDEWLNNDLYRLLDTLSYQNNLKRQHIYFETSDHDVNFFNEQTRLFEQRLSTLGVSYTSAEFQKYPGYDAQSRSFLYDRLENILKFHNKYLRDRNGNY